MNHLGADTRPPRGSRVPTLYRLVQDRTGQSAALGAILVFAVAILGAGAVVALGGDALADIQDTSEQQRAEHTMTLLDSRAAMVALGDTSSQTVSFAGAGDGTLSVRDDAGWIRVEHVNYSASDPPENETVFYSKLGALEYELGDTTLAYEGGGVWRTEDGGTVMVSPPEFHYRDATLTLPIIRVDAVGPGSGASGGASVAVESGSETRRVFPNATTSPPKDLVGAPYNDTATLGYAPYLNPVDNGTVRVTVHSDHYRGWADYFRTRTEGVVTVDNAAETATVELIAVGTLGDFEMPNDGNSLKLRGVNGHSAKDFNISLFADDTDNANFSNLKWSMWAKSGGDEFEVHLRAQGGAKCGDPIDAYIYYSPNGGADYQGWMNDSAYTVDCGDFDGDGSFEKRISVNLTGDTQFKYIDVDKDGKLQHFDPKGGDYTNPVTFDGHGAIWEPMTFNENDRTTIRTVMDHYFAELGPDFDLTVDDFNGDAVNEKRSYGTIDIEVAGGRYITFLHVTENEIRVRID